MRQTLWTLLLMTTVGVFAFTAGWNAHIAAAPQVLNTFHTEQAHVVLAKSGARQSNEARQQSEGCPVTPNGEFSQQKPKEQDTSIMKGLVF
jgi:hypothetical protein